MSRRVSTRHARVRAPRYASVFPKASRLRRWRKPRTNSKEPAADCFACLSLAGVVIQIGGTQRFVLVAKPRRLWSGQITAHSEAARQTGRTGPGELCAPHHYRNVQLSFHASAGRSLTRLDVPQ